MRKYQPEFQFLEVEIADQEKEGSVKINEILS